VRVGWRTAGVYALQRGIGEEERCNGCKSREEKVFTSKHTHQFEFGARIRGKGSCFVDILIHVRCTVS